MAQLGGMCAVQIGLSALSMCAIATNGGVSHQRPPPPPSHPLRHNAPSVSGVSSGASQVSSLCFANGAYFIVSRALGPELGGLVGFFYYIAHSLLAACYCLGVVEIATVSHYTFFFSTSTSPFINPCFDSTEKLAPKKLF